MRVPPPRGGPHLWGDQGRAPLPILPGDFSPLEHEWRFPVPRQNPSMIAPSWMTRPQKREFRRLVLAREEIGFPLVKAELGAVLDYVECRSRIETLRGMGATEAA